MFFWLYFFPSFVVRPVVVMVTPVPVASLTYLSTLSLPSRTRERTRSCSSRRPGTSTSSTPSSCRPPSFQPMSPTSPQTTIYTRTAHWERQSSFQILTFSSRPIGREQEGNPFIFTVNVLILMVFMWQLPPYYSHLVTCIAQAPSGKKKTPHYNIIMWYTSLKQPPLCYVPSLIFIHGWLLGLGNGLSLFHSFLCCSKWSYLFWFADIEWLLWQQRDIKLALNVAWSRQMPGMLLHVTG